MRLCGSLLLLAGCGRLAFDALPAETGGDGGGPDELPLPTLACAATYTPIEGLPANADLVTGALDSDTLVAWTSRTQPSTPVIARLDAQGQLVTTPTALSIVTATAVGAFDAFGSRVLLHVATGNQQTIVEMNAQLADANVLTGGPGVFGRGCIMQELAATVDEPVLVVAQSTQLYGGYLTTTGTGPYSNYDTEETITHFSCHTGFDHVHVVWENTLGQCAGNAIITVPTQPMFGEEIEIAPDCLESRIAIVDVDDDSTTTVWRTSGGAIETHYIITNTPEPTVMITPAGRAPRIASDGTRIWLAWIDTRSGTEELRIGHKLPQGPLVEAPAPGVVPSSDEAFELVRHGTTVHLLVLTASGLRSYELCP